MLDPVLDPIHRHLLINHAPVIGVPFVIVLLVLALVRRSDELARLSLWASVAMAALTGLADLTGDPAAHALRAWVGTTLRPLVHEHEEAADWALIACVITGVVAAAALWLDRRQPVRRASLAAVLLLSLFSAAILARVSELGGQIRHEEIRGGQPPAHPGGSASPPPAAPPAS